MTIGTCNVSHEVPGGVSEDAFITDLNKIPDTRETCTIAAKTQAYDLTIKRTGPTVGECADKTEPAAAFLLGFEDTSKVTPKRGARP